MNPYMRESENKTISFSLLRVERGRGKICKCQFPHFEIDCANRIVICQDCGAVLDPFDALERVAAHMELYAEYQEKALCKVKAFGKLADKEFRRRMRNKAFKEMDANYQKGLLPICPECEQVFDPMRIARWTRGRKDEH